MDRRMSRFGLAAVLAATILAGTGQAATFAQFQMNPAQNLFLFESVPGGATLTATDVPILFTYSNIANVPAELQGAVSARVTVLMQTTANATQTGGINTQPFTGLANSISIDLETPVFGHTNLLTATFDGGELFGLQDGFIALFGSSQPTNNVLFTSDFLNFSGSTGNAASLSFTSVTPSLSYTATTARWRTSRPRPPGHSRPTPRSNSSPSRRRRCLSGLDLRHWPGPAAAIAVARR